MSEIRAKRVGETPAGAESTTVGTGGDREGPKRGRKYREAPETGCRSRRRGRGCPAGRTGSPEQLLGALGELGGADASAERLDAKGFGRPEHDQQPVASA